MADGCPSTHPFQRPAKANWRRQTGGAADARSGFCGDRDFGDARQSALI